MSEPWNGSARERALWRRWAMMANDPAGGLPGGGTAPDALTPDALTLAAFAEDRLDGAARDSVEAFLAANPEIAADVAAARRAVAMPPAAGDAALAAVIARASALVAGGLASGSAGAVVLPFRPARRPVSPLSGAVRWGALAASLVLVSWLGFALGSQTYGSLAALEGQSGGGLADELFDPPGGFFGLVDTSGT